MNTIGPDQSKSMTGLSVMFYRTAIDFTKGMASGRLNSYEKYPAVVVELVTTALDAYKRISCVAAFHGIGTNEEGTVCETAERQIKAEVDSLL
jgi:hypothetical protein